MPTLDYTEKLNKNIELFKQKIAAKSDTRKILKSQKKLKDNLDGVFGKGKRLPCFSVITVGNEIHTDVPKKKKAKKAKK